MPTITLSRKTIDTLVGKKLSDEELKHHISYLGTDLEEVRKDEIIVEIFPNRPDLLSEQGFSRALASFVGVKEGLRQYKVHPSKQKLIIDSSARDIRPWSACAIVDSLSLNDERIREIIQIQEKLHVTYGRNRKKVAIGIYPCEHISFPITLKSLKPEDIIFRPLEMKEEMLAKDILELHPAGKEYGHLLSALKRYPVFVDAKGSVLSMPPVINSHQTGRVTEKTKKVFVECSGFDYPTLSTCLSMIVTALADMGGKIHSMEIEAYGKKLSSPDLTPVGMEIRKEYINRILGLSLEDKDIRILLGKMGHGYEKGKARIPSYRADILHPIDLVEDIAIAHGFFNFRPEIPKVATTAKEARESVMKRAVGNLLAGLGFLECAPYHLIAKEAQTKKMRSSEAPLEVVNALNQEFNTLPRSALPALMDIFSRNRSYDYPQHLFCFLTSFRKGRSETGIKEEERLCVAIAEDTADYTKIRQVLDYALRMFGKEYTVEPTEHPSYIPGRCGKILVGEKEIGIIGELHPETITNWSLDIPVASFELALDQCEF